MEAALLDPQLPAPVLADNKKVVAVMRQFVKNLEPPGGGWPPPFRHPRLTLVFRCGRPLFQVLSSFVAGV